MGLFGKTKAPDPKEQVKEWSSKIRKEGHQLDRQVCLCSCSFSHKTKKKQPKRTSYLICYYYTTIRIWNDEWVACWVATLFLCFQINQIKREELKATRSIKECAKRGDKESAKVLAKEVVASRKAVSRIYTAKANLSSVEMQMRNQASQLRLAGSLQKSSEVMKSMQQLVKLPELQKTMMELSKEMTKVIHLKKILCRLPRNRHYVMQCPLLQVLYSLQYQD